MTIETSLDQSILVAVLARRDALWLPLRGQPNSNWSTEPWVAAVADERQQAHRHGTILPPPASRDDSVSKAHQRAIARLAEAGLLRRGKQSTRQPRAFLTADGEALASGWTAAYQVWYPEAWEAFELCHEFQEAGATNAGHVGEWLLLGKDSYAGVTSPDMVGLENVLLPFLSRGWLTSWHDSRSAIGYHVTAEGKAAIAAGRPDPIRHEYNPALGDLYDDLLASELEARKRLPRDRRHAAVPLSAGRWPETPAEAIQ